LAAAATPPPAVIAAEGLIVTCVESFTPTISMNGAAPSGSPLPNAVTAP
jgi:hypothetical protein